MKADPITTKMIAHKGGCLISDLQILHEGVLFRESIQLMPKQDI
jgi:hypothetical protein